MLIIIITMAKML